MLQSMGFQPGLGLGKDLQVFIVTFVVLQDGACGQRLTRADIKTNSLCCGKSLKQTSEIV
jgi:hypothetical protein